MSVSKPGNRGGVFRPPRKRGPARPYPGPETSLNVKIPRDLDARVKVKAARARIALRTAVCEALDAWTQSAAQTPAAELRRVIAILNRHVHGLETRDQDALSPTVAVLVRAELERQLQQQRKKR